MASFPDDVLRHVFSFLPLETLAQCRLLSRSAEPLARAFLFRHVRLEMGCDVKLFLNIAKTERLRPFVREITVDLSQERPDSDGAEYARGIQIQSCRQTLRAIPLVRLFSGLKTLNLRFSGPDVYSNGTETEEVSPPTFPSTFTENILQCISGCWTKESQDQWVRDLHRWPITRDEAPGNLMVVSEPGDSGLLEELEHFGAVQPSPGPAINLSTLTISNLSEQDSDYLASSSAMRSFFETQSLSTLQLLTTSGPHADDNSPSHGKVLHNRYKFFQSVPSTWLSPSVADRLRTLSLFSQEYWGYIPKMDLRSLGRLPNLRTLALGRYVFTHQWQVDWVAGLGSENGRGGLQELYLDDCPIMWRSRVPPPLDNEGFPREELLSLGRFHPKYKFAVADFGLRWSSVLDEWRQKVPSLKVFRMGCGNWDGVDSTAVAMAQAGCRAPATVLWYPVRQTGCQSKAARDALSRRKRRATDAVHLNYDKPPAEALYQYGPDAIRDGAGLGQEWILRYVHFEIGVFEGPSWDGEDLEAALELEFEDGHQRYVDIKLQDEEALDALYASIGCHNYREVVARYKRAYDTAFKKETQAIIASASQKMPREDAPVRPDWD
ncbi:hypothetical protein KVR01_009193 [Diaporthe batatas]|uniref:uncharacterized protein n=1 Tax=Diaporthe batatas TaxID=748121 RepID=UPI001D058F3A|nr:uncharacterized protein KVR01_009193 [Diaporthe batatas]KAG8160929.1 hypothetical protein KVR01_009193 [Diaporthe batatas]